MVSLSRSSLVGALALAAIFGATVCVAARHAQPGEHSPKGADLRLDAHRTLGPSQSFHNLTIIPVYDKTARSTGAYLTLDEGLKQKLVTVKESKAGGEVNKLYVTNSSSKPVYLMGGEVVLGGQQDRTLGRDTIIPPGSKEVPVTVFCVEHGRWTGRSDFDQTAPTVAGVQIRGHAQEGEFFAARAAAPMSGSNAPGFNAGSASANRRVSGRASEVNRISGAQQQVWDGVAKKNAKLKTENQTGSYRSALTLAAGDAAKSVPAYVTALQDSLRPSPHLVGVVAAVNGKVVAADIFGDPSLFRKLWPKLLRSYASDAVEQTPDGAKKPAIASAANAKAFLLTATDAKSKVENLSDVGTTVRYESGQAITYSLVPNAKSPAAAGALGGGAVHTGVLGK